MMNNRKYACLVFFVLAGALCGFTPAIAQTSITPPAVVNMGGGSVPVTPSDTLIQTVSPPGQHGRIQMFGVNADPIFGCDYSAGSYASPASPPASSILCTWQARGWDGDSFGPAAVQMRAITTEQWGYSSHGAALCFSTNARATTTEDLRFCIGDTGQIHTKTTAPPTLSGCGSGASMASYSTDNAFRFTVGAGVTACTVTFGRDWGDLFGPVAGAESGPVCIVQSENSSAYVRPYNVSQTQMQVAGTLTSGMVIAGHCAGGINPF